MADRLNYYSGQRVTEAELDLGFALLENADRNLATDIGLFGIFTGMIATEHAPLADLTIDLTAPGRAYDQLGRRIFYGSAQNVDVSTDENGLATEVSAAGNEKLLSVFIRFVRLESDPRTDRASQQVFFRQDESFEFVVRQGGEAPIGTATPPPLQSDEILIVDITRTFGQTQITNADLSPNPLVPGDVGRRQAFVLTSADGIGVNPAGFSVLAPAAPNAHSTFDEIDDELADHFGGLARRHTASAIDAAATAGTPNALAGITVRAQLDELLAHGNDHENETTGAHAGSAIAFPGGTSWLGGRTNPATDITAQLDKIVTDLAAQVADDDGAERIGAAAVFGAPNSLPVGSVRAQLDALLGFINTFPAQAHLWTAIQSFTGPNNDTDPRWETLRAPSSGRQLVFELGPPSGIRHRLYYSVPLARFECTVNARWTGTDWERDDTASTAARYVFERDRFDIQQIASTVTQPFGDSLWLAGPSSKVVTVFLPNLAFGEFIQLGRELIISGPLVGYAAGQAYILANANLGGGASFSSGILPSTPSSVTFNVITQFGTDNSPSAFAPSVNGMGWFDSTDDLNKVKYMFLEFTAS